MDWYSDCKRISE